MKITREQLDEVIQEELLNEASLPNIHIITKVKSVLKTYERGKVQISQERGDIKDKLNKIATLAERTVEAIRRHISEK